MLIIYCEKLTNRLLYIIDFIFNNLLGLDYVITDNKQDFINSEHIKLSYSDRPIENEAFIFCSGLLHETELDFNIEKTITPKIQGSTTSIFNMESDSLLNFDIFSASFYLLTRYEEYISDSVDIHGRFPAEKSLAYKYDFLDKPVINIWAGILLDKLQQKYHLSKISTVKKNKYKFLPTIDIDNAWAFKNKSAYRTIGGLLRPQNNIHNWFQRINVLRGSLKDPYDNYDFIRNLHQKYDLKAVYFFLLGDYKKYDKAISFNNKNYRTLIKNIAEYADIGIHPSYYSNKNKKRLKEEIYRIKSISDIKIIRSRQHFLKMTIPQTYRALLECGISEDYTMGYSTQTGFRAGTCTPFNFFDLEANKRTNLKLFPFQLMDMGMKDFCKYQPDEAIKKINELITQVKNVNGTFISLWHNESLSDTDDWSGWKRVYEYLVKTASQ